MCMEISMVMYLPGKRKKDMEANLLKHMPQDNRKKINEDLNGNLIKGARFIGLTAIKLDLTSIIKALNMTQSLNHLRSRHKKSRHIGDFFMLLRKITQQ